MPKNRTGSFIAGGNPQIPSLTSNNGIFDVKDVYSAVGNNAWQEPDGYYEIQRSLRFRNSSGTAIYFERTPSVSGNRRIWTYSSWIKQGDMAGMGRHFGMSPQYGGDGSNESQINFQSDGTIRVYDAGGGAGYFNVNTTTQFKDPTAWYHIVVAVNTTLNADLDRVKIFVNGIRQPIATTTQGSQNQLTGWNHTFRHRLAMPGYSTNTGQGWDGQLAEINHIDGLELDPSYFGYFDPISNIWLPKKYTGSYGVNGFYLPFNQNSSVLMLGKNAGVPSNLITYSEQYNNGAWLKPAAPVAPTVSANTSVAPDGTINADTLNFSTNNTHPVYQEATVPSFATGDTYTASCYVKNSTAGNYSLQLVYFYTAGGNQDGYANFTFNSLGQISSITNSNSYVTATATHVGNGWFRITCTSVFQGGGAGTTIRTSLGQNGNAGAILAWGHQINLGNTADQYRQTIATAVNTSWTPVNLSLTSGVTYDSLVDSPINVFTTATDTGGVVSGNYCTWNSAFTLNDGQATRATLTNANLRITDPNNPAANGMMNATMGVTSGKWYWELTITAASTYVPCPGISFNSDASLLKNGITYDPYGTRITVRQSGSMTNLQTGLVNAVNGDVIGIQLDADNKTIAFYKNNAQVGTTVNYTTYIPTNSDGVYPSVWTVNQQGGQADANFGQRPFVYTPPTGFKSLNTTNLQATGTAAAAASIRTSKSFDVILSAGNTTGRTVSGLEFQPDLVVFKNRDGTSNRRWSWFDSARGTNNHLTSQLTDAEFTGRTDLLTSFNSDGFTVGADAAYYGANGFTERWVQFAWKAASTPTTNNDGTITSVVRANRDAGFSIVTYTGTGTGGTARIGHGLGIAPKMMIVKHRGSSTNWAVYHASLPTSYTAGTQVVYLSDPGGNTQDFNVWDSNLTENTKFSVGASSLTNASASSYVAYCFAEIPGYSKFGSWTGNGSTDGPFIYTGFTPKLVIFKWVAGAGRTGGVWYIYDTVRENPSFQARKELYVNNNAAEYVSTNATYDVLSNGFKIRTSATDINGSGGTFIYAAFAESPFALNNRAR